MRKILRIGQGRRSSPILQWHAIQVKCFNPGFSGSLSILVLIILPHLEYISSIHLWNPGWGLYLKVWVIKQVERKVGNFCHYQNNNTQQATIARCCLKAVIIAAAWLANTWFFYLSWHLIGWWKVFRFFSNWMVCSKLK